ncbi:hypothetical protein S225a_12950 [Candidatus Brocadiaceae bacterium S225]|uniref:Uncharacterized protein n=1 Tax=Candidatus Scalindua brodae TaxID=237368 RepID=A0A0B0EL05_9BACT|nr:MAG: hypothetical protein SCABRO_01524 [Candidatus Scalindua brodae]TWU34038.1 hypothetical protein S225a_12950 [Candidatus Brocadiaceae bacterium S225]
MVRPVKISVKAVIPAQQTDGQAITVLQKRRFVFAFENYRSQVDKWKHGA